MSSLVQTEMGLQVARGLPGVDRELRLVSRPVRMSCSCDRLTVQDLEVGRTLSQANVLGKPFFAGMRLDD